MKEKKLEAMDKIAEELTDPVTRIIGKLIDFLLFLFFTQIFQPYGTAGGIIYLFIADGFHNGKSLGKYLTGSSVVDFSTGEVCSFKSSIIRNFPIGLIALFYVIPIIGWLLFITAGVLIIAIETYFVFRDSHRQRIGDTIANTVVIKNKSYRIKE